MQPVLAGLRLLLHMLQDTQGKRQVASAKEMVAHASGETAKA
jgi:hypothetical protein